MKRLFSIIATLVLSGWTALAEPIPVVHQDSLTLAPFGTVHLFFSDGTPQSVSIMISGDGGWKYGVLDFSKNFAAKGSLVIGVNILQYYKNLRGRTDECYTIVADFENLATTVEKRFRLPRYASPIVMGYSSGATLVYALLAQARPNTFKGGISLGFCPDVELPRPFCAYNGLKTQALSTGRGFDLDPDSRLGNRWIVLQGKLDQVCPFQAVLGFTEKTGDATLIPLEKVGHGFSNWADFMPQWEKAFQSLLAEPQAATAPDQAAIRDLPAVLTEASTERMNAPLVLFISGDGGWYSFEQRVSDHLAADGVPTVGLDAKRYFWNRRSPAESAADVADLLDFYRSKWHKEKIILIGYSMGAGVLPFIFEQLPADLKQATETLVLLSPLPKIDFEIHVADMLGFNNDRDTYDLTAEIRKISPCVPVLLVTGEAERSPMPSALAGARVELATVPGDHHYDNNSWVIFNLLQEKKLL